MKQLITKGIVLGRIDYGEADRIITILTPEQGKLRLMARGVRKIKSKLAGGIELFSVSDLTYITGKGEIGTLISSRLDSHYGQIVKDIERVQLGYEMIKQLHKATEDNPEAAYFELLQQAFEALNDDAVDSGLIQLWFQIQLLKLSGHAPNLNTDTTGAKLSADQSYNFDFEAMALQPHDRGNYHAEQIKAARLLFDGHTPAQLQRVQGLTAQIIKLQPLSATMIQTYLQR